MIMVIKHFSLKNALKSYYKTEMIFLLKRKINLNFLIEINSRKMSCGTPPPPPCGNDCKVSPPRRNVERVRDPTPPPIVKREVKRNPTPPGDTIERVRVTRQPQQIIERVTEQPRKPPPKIIERVENEPCQPLIIRNTCVLVDSSPKLVPLCLPLGLSPAPRRTLVPSPPPRRPPTPTPPPSPLPPPLPPLPESDCGCL